MLLTADAPLLLTAVDAPLLVTSAASPSDHRCFSFSPSPRGIDPTSPRGILLPFHKYLLSISYFPLPCFTLCLKHSVFALLLCASLLFYLTGLSNLKMKVSKGKGAVKKDKNEVLKPVEERVVGKRKAAVKASKSSSKRAKKVQPAKKDPNKPKRPPSAFFVFLEEFRKVYKQEHPNVKGVAAVGKAGGEKWKSLTDAEKAPYEVKAAKRKSDYEKLMTAYNKKQESSDDEDEEESEKSKSEVHDDDEELEEEDEEDDGDEDDD